MHTGTTLTQFIIEEQRHIAGATGDFTALLNDIVTAIKTISNAVNKGALIGVMGALETENVQGETQKKLDVITNEMMIRNNEWAGHLAGMASEEMDELYPLPTQYPLGKYLRVFDPLDGSSNVDVNISVGTIFSILKAPVAGRAAVTEDFLQPGAQQVCAGYAIYGSSTMLVLTFGHGTNGFTLDRDIGEFVLTHPNMQIPTETKE
ncbi:MAG: class 1 fructose-bisphosphatase, partial [Pseudomonadota bacterium]|nr:class 1 fructose-bisphosphatase [Pseudomonadota bacterium]